MRGAFTSPVSEVVTWGEDTRPEGGGLWEAPARSPVSHKHRPLSHKTCVRIDL